MSRLPVLNEHDQRIINEMIERLQQSREKRGLPRTEYGVFLDTRETLRTPTAQEGD